MRVWGATQCSNLIAPVGVSTVEECKRACLNKNGCTAIITDQAQHCVLKGCELPIPIPRVSEQGRVGHALLNGNYNKNIDFIDIIILFYIF